MAETMPERAEDTATGPGKDTVQQAEDTAVLPLVISVTQHMGSTVNGLGAPVSVPTGAADAIPHPVPQPFLGDPEQLQAPSNASAGASNASGSAKRKRVRNSKYSDSALGSVLGNGDSSLDPEQSNSVRGGRGRVWRGVPSRQNRSV